jgi:flavin-dependent dehydrogenase
VEADYDVLIIGARTAGSVTASLLGEAGLRVLLVDAAAFPSDTISTHFFRGAGLVSVLERLDLLDRVLALGPPPLTRGYVFHGRDPAPSVEAPQDPGAVGYCLSVRRLPLDALLLERARGTKGVEVWEAAPAHALVHDHGGRVVGATVERNGETRTVSARIVVGADGRGSAVARWVGAPIVRREVASRAMYFRYLRGYRGPNGSWDGPEFSFLGDELAYAFPSDDDVTCLAISINLETFAAFRAAPAASFNRRILDHPGIGPRFEAATPDSRILASGPRDALIRMSSGPGWALVGDAAMSQDPWTGLGMDNASIHATFLADAIDAWLGGRANEGTAFADYASRRDEHALADFIATAEQGRDLSRL